MNENNWADLLIGPALTAAVVAAVVALLQVLFTARRERKNQLLEFRLRQANELYGPILVLLAEDHILIRTIREACKAPEKGWFLFEHLEEIKRNAHLQPIAKRIRKVNLEIIEILKTKSGLTLQGKLPDSYHQFIAHADLMARSIEKGEMPGGVEIKYFPKQFEDDIQATHAELVGKIRKSLRE